MTSPPSRTEPSRHSTAPEQGPLGDQGFHQPAQGYRYSADALLLADFAGHTAGQTTPPPSTIVDACSGCGVVGVLLAQAHPDARVWCVERDPELHACCEVNVHAGGLQERVHPVLADVRRWMPDSALAGVDLIAMNPPFYTVGRGRLSPHPQRAAARHQLHGGLDELVAACARHLAPQGRLCVVYPTAQLQCVLAALQHHGLLDVTLQFVHGHVDAPSTIVLVRAVRARHPRTRTLPPRIHRHRNGGTAPVARTPTAP